MAHKALIRIPDRDHLGVEEAALDGLPKVQLVHSRLGYCQIVLIKRLEARSPSDTGWVLSGVVALGFASLVAFVLSAISLAYPLIFSIDSLVDEFGAGEETADRRESLLLTRRLVHLLAS